MAPGTYEGSSQSIAANPNQTMTSLRAEIEFKFTKRQTSYDLSVDKDL